MCVICITEEKEIFQKTAKFVFFYFGLSTGLFIFSISVCIYVINLSTIFYCYAISLDRRIPDCRDPLDISYMSCHRTRQEDARLSCTYVLVGTPGLA